MNCPKCNQPIADAEAKFCPKCGADIQSAVADWTCAKCGQVNSADADFCKNCGDSRDKQTKLIYSEKFRYALAVVAVILIGGLGSYFYFNGANEQRYLTNYAAAQRDLNEVNNIVVTNVKFETLNSAKPETLTEQLKTQKDVLDAQAKIFSDIKPFTNYDAQHADLITLLNKESEIIAQVIQVVSKPLDSTVDATIENIKTNVSAVKSLEEKIKVPNANFVSTVNLSAVPEQLNIFVAEQRKVNAAKMEKLAANQEFFRQMDDAIHRYDGAKSDLGKILESNQKSGMIWADYFSVLDRAKSERTSIRSTVSEIVAPPGTENLKRDFRAVLDSSISYCELMREAANLGFNNYHRDRFQKESAAKDVDAQVQRDYAAFTDAYNSAKNRLLNVNNL
ncbi:MAG: zinc ribbon domain-containing protein [Selenomonadaceae bacterium]|nr:zinc ribbon domain-containing protein [Selenomonadaceae bacterium]